MTIYLNLLSIFLGACLGSYAALIIDRIPRGVSTVAPRSRCNSCGKTIKIWQNIPILSWLILRGKCFYCSKPIGLRALFIEIIFALALFAIMQKFGLSFLALEKFIFVFLLICLAYIDLDTFYLPNILIIFLISLGLLSTAYYFLNPHEYINLTNTQPLLQALVFKTDTLFSWKNRLGGAFFGFAFLAGINILATFFLRKRGRLNQEQWAMGFGDPLLMMAIGIFVGLSHLALTIFLASFFGSIFGIAQKIIGNKNMANSDIAEGAIPFGPFLALAGIYVYLF